MAHDGCSLPPKAEEPIDIMKTASFFSYTGPGRISIARLVPRRTPAGYKIFRALAPGSWFNSVSEAEYNELFRVDILGPLKNKARETHERLVELAGGHEPVLLCWEKPADENTYCHRAIVARFFEEKLGIEVPEIGYEGKPHPLLTSTANKMRLNVSGR